jgi:hypothetical protein
MQGAAPGKLDIRGLLGRRSVRLRLFGNAEILCKFSDPKNQTEEHKHGSRTKARPVLQALSVGGSLRLERRGGISLYLVLKFLDLALLVVD